MERLIFIIVVVTYVAAVPPELKNLAGFTQASLTGSNSEVKTGAVQEQKG